MKFLTFVIIVLTAHTAFASVPAALQISLRTQGKFGVSRYDLVEIHSARKVKVNGLTLSQQQIKRAEKELKQLQIPPKNEAQHCAAGIFRYEVVAEGKSRAIQGCARGMNYANVFVPFAKLRQIAESSK